MAKRGPVKLVYQPANDGAGGARDERRYLHPMMFADNASGTSLLDVGCNLGLFCREAARHGIAAVGIDADPQAIAAAGKLAEGLTPLPTFIAGDFENWEFGNQRFDTVAALNVLHHLFDPVHALRKMMALASSRIVLEVAQPTWRDHRILIGNPGFVFARFVPVIWVAESGGLHRVGSRTFLFTRRALRVLFNEHTAIFEPLKFHRSPFKGRLIVEARRRNIGHLVVVSGPTASGKSTFEKRFSTDATFRHQFVSDGGDWTTINAAKVNDLPAGRLDRVLLHYDFMRLRKGSLKTYEREPVLDILSCAERVTVITLAVNAARLVRQLENGSVNRAYLSRKRRFLELRDSYQTPGYLASWYEAWLDYCATNPNVQQRILVENAGSFEKRPTESWQMIVSGQVDQRIS